MRSDELDYDLPPELIAQHPADRRDALAAARLRARDGRRPPPDVRRPAGRARRRARRRQRHEGRARPPAPASARPAATPRCCSSSRSATGSGRRSPARRGGCGRASGSGRSSCSSRSARDAGASGSTASRTASRRCRRTSTSRSPSRAATRPSTPPIPARPRRRRRVSTSRRSCSRELDVERVTLHVGLDTFRPLAVDELEEHELHGERYRVAPEAWARIEAAERVLAVGTTTVRVLETIARDGALEGRTSLYVLPGLRVQARRRAADELPPAPLDAPRARDGVRRRRRGARPLPARDRRGVPVLLLRRCDADPVTGLRSHSLAA